jgi:type III pantothenate kinase
MNLLLDIGNARIKWAWQDSDHWKTGEPLIRRQRAFKDLARPTWKDLQTPDRVIVSSVAGEDYNKSVQTWVKRRWKLIPEFLHAEAQQCGVSNAYSRPERLGSDRWANLLAAHAHYQEPAVVIDCGTAITIDAIAGDGSHLGGLIVPGMDLMATAMAEGAPGVQIQEHDKQEVSLLGRSTEAALSGGILYAVVALIDRVCLDLKVELGDAASILLTGGDAIRIIPLLSSKPDYDPDLVLKGLAVFAEETAPCAT